MLEQLVQQLERRAGSASITLQRVRPGDWQATIFKDHPKIDEVVYISGAGDTAADAIARLLEDPYA